MSDFIEEIIRNSPKWIFKEVDDKEVEEFSKRTGYSRVASRIFLLRGIRTDKEFQDYLKSDIYSLYNPFLFSQMEKAVNRVKKAVSSGEKIFIFGDRDVDGVLSTAMMNNMLRRFNVPVVYRVPEGEYGYGMEVRDIDLAHKLGTSLIITVDTGISSVEEIDYAGSLGMETIVLDHHIQLERLPEAFAILNPVLEEETYPFAFLSGGGVVLKFIHAFIFSFTKNYNRIFITLLPQGDTVRAARVVNGIVQEYMTINESINYPIPMGSTVVKEGSSKIPSYFEEWLKENRIDQISIISSHENTTIEEFTNLFIKVFIRRQKRSMEFVHSFLDLAAISTISDIMPLVDENRILVKEGLKRIPHTSNLGLKVLLGYCDLPDRELTARDVAWAISPLVNSAGRMGDAHIAVELFTTDDLQRANELSKLLIELNEKRKEKGEKNLSIIRPIVEDKYYKDPIIVLSTDKAEHGVTGIIASKIARRFSKPAIIIVNDGKIGIGSGRGAGDFDLASLVSRCSDLLMKYGGHRSAVGFTIATDNIETFRERIHMMVNEEGSDFNCQEVLEVEAVLLPEDITFKLIEELSVFEPTGVGNPPPQFAILGISVINPVAVGKDKKHLKFYIPTKRGILPVIGWGFSDKGFRILEEGSSFDLLVSLEDNIFRGERTLQLILLDIRVYRDRKV